MAETVFSSASLTKKLQDILMKSSSSDASVADRVDNDNDGGVEGRDDIDAKDQQLLQVANNLFRRKKFPEAAKGYRNVLEISVSDMMKSRASNNLCHLLYKRGNLVEALAFAKKRTELRPTNYKGYFWLALISSKLRISSGHFKDEDKAVLKLANLLISWHYKKVAMFLYQKFEKVEIPNFFSAIRGTDQLDQVTSKIVEVNSDRDLNHCLRSQDTDLVILLHEGSYEVDFGFNGRLSSSIIGIGSNVQVNVKSTSATAVNILSGFKVISNVCLNFEGSQLRSCCPDFWSPVVITDCRIVGFSFSFPDPTEASVESFKELRKVKSKLSPEMYENALNKLTIEAHKVRTLNLSNLQFSRFVSRMGREVSLVMHTRTIRQRLKGFGMSRYEKLPTDEKNL